MKYKIITHREEETEFGKIWIDVQTNDGKQYGKNRHMNVCIRQSLTERDKKYGHTGFFPEYEEIKALIILMIEIHGKAEVEKELGIKIK